MNRNVIINKPERLDDDIEDFRIDACEAEKNFTASKIKVCRDPEQDKPIIFYSQELIRNFKQPSDPFGKRHIIRAYTPSNFTAAVDTTLERKFADTMLAHKPQIQDYSPLTDIHSETMNLFVDDDTAIFLSDVGINVDGMGEDFQGIESVAASPFMENVAKGAQQIKLELAELRRQYNLLKDQMVDAFEEYTNPQLLTDEEFAERLAHETISEALIQQYLSLTEKITKLEQELRLVSSEVFNETITKIRLPGAISNKAQETCHGLFTI